MSRELNAGISAKGSSLSLELLDVTLAWLIQRLLFLIGCPQRLCDGVGAPERRPGRSGRLLLRNNKRPTVDAATGCDGASV